MIFRHEVEARETKHAKSPRAGSVAGRVELGWHDLGLRRRIMHIYRVRGPYDDSNIHGQIFFCLPRSGLFDRRIRFLVGLRAALDHRRLPGREAHAAARSREAGIFDPQRADAMLRREDRAHNAAHVTLFPILRDVRFQPIRVQCRLGVNDARVLVEPGIARPALDEQRRNEVPVAAEIVHPEVAEAIDLFLNALFERVGNRQESVSVCRDVRRRAPRFRRSEPENPRRKCHPNGSRNPESPG